jgi:phosphatidylglycerol---prolipoprotein diacylglyceryl transferase
MYPNLFKIGPLTIHTYGLFLALAFLVGMRIAVHYAKREKMDPAAITDLVVYIFLSALIGAKLLLVVVDFKYYMQDWSRLLSIYQVGGVYYGGFIAAFLVSLWYIRRKKMNFWQTADVLVMGIAFGQILGRFGCFFAGCCWGKPAPNFPLAVVFTRPEAAEQVGTPLNIPLHAAQLYEALPMILVFALLAYFYNRRKFLGQQLCLYLIFYSILRFNVEFFRGDPRGSIGFFSTSQVISILAFAGAIIIYFFRRSVRSVGVAVSKERA